jgi:prephenate dehydrogenase
MINVCIVGLGHIGGSLGKALLKAGGYKVYGVSRKSETLKKALKIKACHGVFKNIAEIKNCDIIVLCVPVDKIAGYYKKFAKSSAVITDVGSVKGQIEAEIKKVKAKKADFVGAHPMAGREFSGIDSADETIFNNAKCVITGSIKNSAKNEKLVSKMWRDAGCEIIKMTSTEHDRLTALTSHLPHIIAFCLKAMFNDVKRKNPKIEKVAAGSFKSATRVAESKAETWQPILNLNRAEISRQVKTFLKMVKQFNPKDIKRMQTAGQRK